MSRQVRRVPANWVHPSDGFYRDGSVRYVSLMDGFNKAVAEWDLGNEMWSQGHVRDWGAPVTGWKPKGADDTGAYANYSGDRPDPADYMPDWPEAERTHFMMYETVSEGSPISPAFATAEELARWLADTGASSVAGRTASYEAWLRVCQGAFAPTMIISAETGLISGVEATVALKRPA